MTISVYSIYVMVGVGTLAFFALLIMAFSDGTGDLEKRLARVAQTDGSRKINRERSLPGSVKSNKDSSIPIFDMIIKALPNLEKLRSRLATTGREIALGEYILVNIFSVALFYVIAHVFELGATIEVLIGLAFGLFIPHSVVGFMGARRIKKFLASFPEAIDTMCRGIRSGLPITESIRAVGREMPDPIGIEFHRISDAVRMGKSLEAAMWDVSHRIDAPEFRFLIIAMTIQKETGGNLAETLGNLADLIRKRRQLRLKIKAMSSEAKASAMIIGSLPFIMFSLLMIVNSSYVMLLFQRSGGQMMVAGGLLWMSIGWGVMMKMVSFEI